MTENQLGCHHPLAIYAISPCHQGTENIVVIYIYRVTKLTCSKRSWGNAITLIMSEWAIVLEIWQEICAVFCVKDRVKLVFLKMENKLLIKKKHFRCRTWCFSFMNKVDFKLLRSLEFIKSKFNIEIKLTNCYKTY